MIEFRIEGAPAPKGSTRSFASKSTGKVVTVGACKRTKEWERAVKAAGLWAGLRSNENAWNVELRFRLHRPKARKKSLFHVTRPDLDKLARAVLDGLTGVAYRDDSQVRSLDLLKEYVDESEAPGCLVRLTDEGPERGEG